VIEPEPKRKLLPSSGITPRLLDTTIAKSALGLSYASRRLLIAVSPPMPDSNDHAAAGIGTADAGRYSVWIGISIESKASFMLTSFPSKSDG
jgi:hypothetical protein